MSSSVFGSRDSNGVSPFTWRLNGAERHFDKDYVYDEYINPYPIGFIPKFQYIREGRFFNANPVTPIDQFILVRCEDGVAVDILNRMKADHGFEILEDDAYDGYHIITNPATSPLSAFTPSEQGGGQPIENSTSTNQTFEFEIAEQIEGQDAEQGDQYVYKEGMHYCIMVSGSSTFRSEPFVWKTDMSRFLKITYWHDEAFVLAYGHVNYSNFRFDIYLESQLGFPDFPTIEDINERLGYFFPVQQTSFTEYKFSASLPEYMCRAMSKIFQHRFITVTSRSTSYYLQRFIMGSPQPEERGDIAAVDFSFYTDTVSTVSGAIKAADFSTSDYNEDNL